MWRNIQDTWQVVETQVKYVLYAPGIFTSNKYTWPTWYLRNRKRKALKKIQASERLAGFTSARWQQRRRLFVTNSSNVFIWEPPAAASGSKADHDKILVEYAAQQTITNPCWVVCLLILVCVLRLLMRSSRWNGSSKQVQRLSLFTYFYLVGNSTQRGVDTFFSSQK